MLRSALLWASQNKTIARQLPNYRFARKAVTRFMPGENVDDALRAGELLRAQGIPTVITRLGENVTEASEADDVRMHYADVLATIAGLKQETQISVKPTQLALDIDEARCVDNLKSLADSARRVGNFVWIDMEYSSYVDRTIAAFDNVRDQHSNVGLCIQAYLHRTPKDLEHLIKSTTAIRLVKGAYRESADVAIQSKKDVDEAYMKLATRLLEETATGREVGAPPAFATHDLNMLNRITTTARNLGIPNDAFEIQMLYGIQRNEQLRFAQQGYRVRVLISYGSAWFPWFMRRLAERPANLWFLVKNIAG
ncbi:MAG: proline dehydrogenase family protein [Gemmatimonadota bacterium]